LENLLKKDETFWWTLKCDKAFETVKEKLITAPILIFPDWEKEFHVHVDASGISLGAIVTQPERWSYGSPYILCESEAVASRAQLHNDRIGRISNDLRFTEI
jgi:hypothetical protein